MIGDAALARTVVVQNVTEPRPALIHAIPRNRFRKAGCWKTFPPKPWRRTCLPVRIAAEGLPRRSATRLGGGWGSLTGKKQIPNPKSPASPRLRRGRLKPTPKIQPGKPARARLQSRRDPVTALGESRLYGIRIGRLGRSTGLDGRQRRCRHRRVVAKHLARLAPFGHRQIAEITPFFQQLSHHGTDHLVGPPE